MSVKTREKVYVMMSGGVDSSVSAALLVDAGYEVTGVFMKNWSESIPGIVECSSMQDADDARAVAEKLGIPFKIWNFEKEYRERVFEPMIEEYKRGRTPNPDVNCNSEVKFKLFFERALNEGADYVASGHYARIGTSLGVLSPAADATPRYSLLKAVDSSKDQTYFLYRLTQKELSRTLFPVGGMLKSDVRAEAKKRSLITATKKDSQGLCFVGDVAFKELLKRYIPSRTGPVISAEGEILGEHDGAEFVTIGQRSGLGIGGGTPLFVVDKDIEDNTVTVAMGESDLALYSDTLAFDIESWTSEIPDLPTEIEARIRYRSSLVSAILYRHSRGSENQILGRAENDNLCELEFERAQKAITPGQAVVLYRGDEVVGGGVINGSTSSLVQPIWKEAV